MRSSAQKRSCTAASLRPAPARNSFKSLVNSAASGTCDCAKTAAEENNNRKTVERIRPMRVLLPLPRPSKKGGRHHIPTDTSGTDFFRETAAVVGRGGGAKGVGRKKKSGCYPKAAARSQSL